MTHPSSDTPDASAGNPPTADGPPLDSQSAALGSIPSGTPSGPSSISIVRRRRVKLALMFFSLTAYLTGVLLLSLLGAMIAVYGFMGFSFADGQQKPFWFAPIAISHGYAYLAFIISIVNLGVKARWTPSKWIITALGGVVPFLSFYVEAKRRKEVEVQFGVKEL